MWYQERDRDDGVSPVVGVMLMLVVTIIIAAVVSAFAGSLSSDTNKAPAITVETHIVNDGSWGGSGINFAVLAASESIPTKDLRIVTNWKASNGTRGGATVTGPGGDTPNTVTYIGTKQYHSPLGFGPGVQEWVSSGDFKVEQYFGNFTLMANTNMHSSAFGSMASSSGTGLEKGGYGVDPSVRWQYTDGTNWETGTDSDGVMAILGENWHHLRPGDIVHVRFVHLPTGSVIYDTDIPVEG